MQPSRFPGRVCCRSYCVPLHSQGYVVPFGLSVDWQFSPVGKFENCRCYHWASQSGTMALTGYGVLEVLNLKIQAIESFPSCSTYVINICMCRQKGKSGGCKGNKGYKAFLFSTLALKHEQSPLSSSNIAVLRYIRYSVSLRQRWRNRDLFLKEHICFPLPCQKTRSRIEKNI